jgi:hypothetical protein
MGRELQELACSVFRFDCSNTGEGKNIKISFLNTANKNSKLMLVFWIITLCGLVGKYKSFRRAYCLIP